MSGKTKNRVISILLVLMMLFSIVPNAVFASDTETPDLVSSAVELDWSSVENEDLFAGYVYQLFYGDSASMWGRLAKEQLGENEQMLYDTLRSKIESVAFGVDASTTAVISDNVSKNFTDDTIAQSLYYVFEALLHDCPYDLYWFDKTSSASCRYSYNPSTRVISDLAIIFPVEASYRADGYDPNNPEVNAEKAAKAIDAVNNAVDIVNKYASLNDYDKLKSYCDEICALVSYNHDAASDSYTDGYGDPWQMIYVFDGDDSTKVVCEGYAKAFQYLCDMSRFENDVYCYSVSGIMSGGTGAGNHMWNIVSINDKSYLVDVTNSDTGAIGANYALFLAGTEGNILASYTFAVNGDAVTYTYDYETINLWGSESDSILGLSKTAFNPAETGSGDGSGDSEEVTNGYKLTFVYDERLCDFNVYDWYTGNSVMNGGYLPINVDDNRAQGIFEVSNIADGYRIKDCTINGKSYQRAIIDGAYGGFSTAVTQDATIEVILEEVPENLPEIESVVLYTNMLHTADSKVAENIAFDDSMYGLHAVVTFADREAYPDYYAVCSWEYSTDGEKTWKEVPGWGTSTTFNANWNLFSTYYDIDFMTMENYALRVCVMPKTYYSTAGDAGCVYSQTVKVNGDSQSGSTIKQLAAPTNLKWNVNAQGETEYGFISWDTVDNCEGEYTITMYKDGERYKLPFGNTSIRNYVGIYEDTAYLNFKDFIFESGTYTFSIQAMGDDVNYTDSNLAYSGEYVYTRPAKALGTSTELKWVGMDPYWKAVDGAAYYSIYYYKEDRKIGTSFRSVNKLSMNDGWVYLTDKWLFNLIDRTENGAGKYSFKVQAYSDDITLIANGGVSEQSPATNVGETAHNVNTLLDSLNNAVESGVLTAEEARTDLLNSELMIEDANNLSAAMAAKDDVILNMTKLEDAYVDEKGISVDVNVANDALNCGVAKASEISITGAALNTTAANDEVSFNISKSKTDYPMNNAMEYKNTVFMDMNLSGDGINPDGSLSVPVYIKMPVPDNITVPERFRILHFLNSAGDYELIVPAITEDNGTYYASFILTHFSPFAFTEALSPLEIENGAGGSTASLKGDVNQDSEVNMDDVVALLNHVVKADIITDSAALAAGEVTNDTELNMDDVVKLLNYVVKAIDSLD